VLVAETGAQAAAMMIQPSFDFTRQVVLSTAIDKSLVPARNMRMVWIRGGLHVSGQADGTSLVVLPQQFSHCLRARDKTVRLVRANLMLTGVVFSGEVDTDIVSTMASLLLGVGGLTSRILRNSSCKSVQTPLP
jgi:hypothetical protein